jgi:hypothetical protein
MNAKMDAALKDTPLLDDWKEANRLWSKGFALRKVADAIRRRTKGTPIAEQSPDLSPVPTQLRGPSIVNRLNELSKSGDLQRAFTPKEISNLRQAADVLDRASEKVGKELKVGYGLHSTFYRNMIGLPFLPLIHVMTTDAGLAAIKAGNVAALNRLVSGTTFAAGATAGNMLRSLQGKPTGVQKRELQEMRSTNPNMPTGEER